jgi:transposase
MDIVQEAPDTVFLAEDEASLYLQATTKPVWSPRGQTPVVRVDPSREKTCFYGTLDLQSGRVIAMRSAVMNGAATALHLRQVLAAIPERPILRLWDHAPWHQGPLVRALLAENPRLEILPLPVAAPETNPQEQVWKATRGEVSHNHTQKRTAELADRFEKHLTSHVFSCSLLDQLGYNKLRPMFI